jgi:tRNA threonylcarbamoyladenosine biosynthesis protein TsaE
VNEDVAIGTAAQMRDLGRAVAGLLRAGDIVILSGPLGAGKTTLTQGIGEGLGVRGPITSPTFVIARVHPALPPGSVPGSSVPGSSVPGSPGHGSPGGKVPLVHVDAYRLGSALELDDLDLDTDVEDAVTVVEWGEGLAEGLAPDRLEICITRGEPSGNEPDLSDQPRTVRITGVGPRWQDIRMPRADVSDRL